MAQDIKNIEFILNKYPSERRYTMAILHDVQKEYGCVNTDSMKAVAEYLGVSLANIFSNITFYKAFTTEKLGNIVIQVCDGTVCHSQNNRLTLNEFENILGIKAGETTTDGLFTLRTVNCMGACGHAPVVTCNGKTFGDIKKGNASEFVEASKEHRKPDVKTGDQIDILETGFERVLLKPANSMEAYMAQGGFKGLENAINYPKRREIIDEVKQSGLRGRSGSGFPVADKWKSAYNAPGRESNLADKYVIANGDEGDPGAFMDRWLMEENPYAIIEGLIIAGCAVGANKGYIYIRDEYLIAIERVQNAIEETRKKGFLGKRILGTSFSFDCEVIQAARSYVCGEESALMESIEGKPGIPRLKPPLPTIKGISDQPTVINNVETLVNVPLILREGGRVYAMRGTAACTGTKLLSVAGKVKKKGLVEVPMGKITFRELIYDIGGGMEDSANFKCIQTGGPSGGFLGEECLDSPIDFDSVAKCGSMLGSGGIIVIDDTACAVDMAKYMIEFLSDESCGTCTPCREGLRVILDILTKITEGRGELEDIELMKELSFVAGLASRCALGKTIGNPVMASLKLFGDEYMEHIRERKCPAGVCRLRRSEQENI